MLSRVMGSFNRFNALDSFIHHDELNLLVTLMELYKGIILLQLRSVPYGPEVVCGDKLGL